MLERPVLPPAVGNGLSIRIATRHLRENLAMQRDTSRPPRHSPMAGATPGLKGNFPLQQY